MCFIFPFAWTMKVSSESSSTAFVFSSCSGRGALTKARIHGGASPARTGPVRLRKRTAMAATAGMEPKPVLSITGRNRNRLQNNLLFIGIFHHLIEITKSRVVFLLESNQIDGEMSFQVQRAVFAFRL